MQCEIFTKPLSVNRYYATKNSTIYITPRGKLYRAGIRNGLSEHTFKIIDTPIKLTIHIKLQKKRKFDIDNCLKPLLDSMQGFIFKDDS
jgi:Holliday junction resolvase RusA-like endonuclease